MKRAFIAILVCTAGAGAMAAFIGGRAQPTPAPPDESAKTLSIPPRPARPQTEKSERLSLVDPAVTAAPPVMQTPAADLPLQASESLRAGFMALQIRDTLSAIAWRDRLPPGSVEWKTLTWAIAVSGQTATPSSELLMAKTMLHGWPALDDIEENLEKALFRENIAPQTAAAAIGATQAQSLEGEILLIRARIAAGDEAGANTRLEKLWSTRLFDVAAEDRLLTEFGARMSAENHRARLVRLLYAEKFAQAARFAALGKAEPLAQAFIGVVKRDKKAKDLLDQARGNFGQDPAFLFASVKQARYARRFREAAQLLASAPKDQAALVDPGAWWVETRIVSRMLLEQGRAADAYKLAAAHLSTAPSDIVEAEFHAGWYALRGLKDPKRAVQHFNAILAASRRAHDQARAYYWLGRAAEAGSGGDAKAFFLKASDYPATFYGQLAASRIGVAIRPQQRYRPLADIVSLMKNRPEMQAIELMLQCGQDGRARRLYLALARTLESPTELQALADSALSAQGPALALAIGKTALNQGHDPGMAAFPLGAIPDSADISGAGKALAYAIARQESAFNPKAVSPADARGLLQILPSTAKTLAAKHQLAWAEEKLIEDPGYNATLGSHYLGEQIDKFKGSYILTFAAYNAGPGRIPQWIKRYGDPRKKKLDDVVDWIETIPFQETRDYVQKVMENYQVYKALLNQPADIASDLTAGRQ
ncbi:lytic transglycosylase domain-containing protein [Rhizobium sp. FKL33]|uniref:lytic transglycosylase domain-containing protein n=1 Tax=Rhizobium sp. FKL33 TaxID=2562307 RepID=UPI0010C06EA0|nr:lytic transglycosylase domain-containing protein [Rhizobium sp. FKL33]